VVIKRFLRKLCCAKASSGTLFYDNYYEKFTLTVKALEVRDFKHAAKRVDILYGGELSRTLACLRNAHFGDLTLSGRTTELLICLFLKYWLRKCI